MSFRYIDLFAGIGGFRYGFEEAELGECVWSCEIDKFAQQVYRYHWGSVDADDIREVQPEDIPDHECIVGGFPCQSFSLAGDREGFGDTRGTLFHEICRIAEHHQPSWLFLENVQGLLSTQDRQAFRVVLQSLDDLGYDAVWQVLNSKDFGLPQNRPRVFIIGHLRGRDGNPREILPITRANTEGVEDESGDRGGVEDDDPTTHPATVSLRDGVQPVDKSPCLDTCYRKGLPALGQPRAGVVKSEEDDDKKIKKVGNIFPSDHDAGDVLDPSGISKTLRPQGPRGATKIQSPKIMEVDEETNDIIRIGGLYDKEDERHQIGSVYHPEGISALLDTSGGGYREPMVVRDEDEGEPTTPDIEGIKIRKLTPKECERLQGFPDEWTAKGVKKDGDEVEISDNQRYKQLGNAVSVPVVKFIGERIKYTIEDIDRG